MERAGTIELRIFSGGSGWKGGRLIARGYMVFYLTNSDYFETIDKDISWVELDLPPFFNPYTDSSDEAIRFNLHEGDSSGAMDIWDDHDDAYYGYLRWKVMGGDHKLRVVGGGEKGWHRRV